MLRYVSVTSGCIDFIIIFPTYCNTNKAIILKVGFCSPIFLIQFLRPCASVLGEQEDILSSIDLSMLKWKN